MQGLRKIISKAALIIAVITCFTVFPTFASESDAPTLDEATAVFFYHIEGNQLICSKNEEKIISAGSSVKLMSGLLFATQLQDRLSETVFITPDMVNQSAGYRLYIEKNDILSVEQLLYAALCGSYNDAYDVLACYIAGSKEDFVKQMNQTAKELGAVNTVFTDPSGVDDNSVTTAADLAKIALAAYQNLLYMQITSTTRYAFPATQKLSARTVSNRNALIYSELTTQYHNEKCMGMSAGYTPRGGNCVITVAGNASESYLCIVMGAGETANTNYSYQIAIDLIDWVYDSYANMEILNPDTVICTIPVTVADMKSTVTVKTHQGFSYYLPIGLEVGKDILFSVRLIRDTLEAPVAEGELVGYLAILYQGQTLETLPLYTAESAERSSFIGNLKNLKLLTQSRAFRAGAIFFVVVLCTWITTEAILVRRRRHKWDKYFSSKSNPPPNYYQSK